MYKMKYLIVVLAAVFLASCDEKEAVQTVQTNNRNFEVSDLFEHKGCTVHRFTDGGRSHYYVTCEGGSTNTSSVHNCGKNCTYQEDIPVKIKYRY